MGNLVRVKGAYTQPVGGKKNKRRVRPENRTTVTPPVRKAKPRSTQADGQLGGQFGSNPPGMGGRRPPVSTLSTGTTRTPRFDTEGFGFNPTSYTTPRFDTESMPLSTMYPSVDPQLSRVNENIVAIGGYKYHAPTLSSWLGQEGSLIEDTEESPQYTMKRRRRGGGGYSYSSGSSGYGSGYNSLLDNVMSWRVATG